MKLTTPRRTPFAPGLLALALAGCGVGDYEEKIAAEQKRLAQFDREEKELGGPMELPAAPDGQTFADMFLRVPKGVATRPEPTPYAGLLYEYKATTPNAPAGRMYLAWPAGRKEFKNEIVRTLVPKTQTEGKATTAPPPGRPPVELSVTTIGQANAKGEIDRTTYLYLPAGGQVAILYEVAGDKPGKAAFAAIAASLNTLAVGADAGKARSEFGKRPRAKK